MSTSLVEVHAEIGAIENAEQMASSPVPEPFVLPTGDEDIIADLAAIGITFGTTVDEESARAAEQSQREAMGAIYLDHASRCDERAAELAATRDKLLAPLQARIARIERFYAAQITYENRRREELLRFVEYLAQLCQYPGKKKSIATPFGSFGFRDVSPTVELTDEAAAIEWAKQMAPGFVSVAAKLDLAAAREYFTEPELAACKQSLKWGELKKHVAAEEDLPPGVQRIAGGRQFYAKLEVR